MLARSKEVSMLKMVPLALVCACVLVGSGPVASRTQEQKEKIREKIREANADRSDVDWNNMNITLARPGESAIGAIVDPSSEDEVNVDVDPCKLKRIHNFRRPFRKEDTGLVTQCGDREVKLFAVEQR
jgi:hypothetical protein